jgi:UDP-2,3-diacylglucosamine hydrolase
MPEAPARQPSPPAAGRSRTFEAPADWRAIDLISDLHLAENTPEVFAAWATHLRYTDADAVFILGDLFEVWIGDDMAERGFEARCVEVLSAAAAERMVAFMPGNRDFLVGDAMLGASGVVRLADPTLVVAFDDRVVLSHGDALCVDDVAYQRYRAVVRRPAVQRAFRALPFAARQAIGRGLRKQSARRPPRAHGDFVDVDADAALAWLRDASATTLVHGHTHRPRATSSRRRDAPRPQRLGARRQQSAARRDPALGCERVRARRAGDSGAVGAVTGWWRAGAARERSSAARSPTRSGSRRLRATRSSPRAPQPRSRRCARWRRCFSRRRNSAAPAASSSTTRWRWRSPPGVPPALELGLAWLDGFVGIVVHPDAVVAHREREDEVGVVHTYDEELSGEAMHGGPVMLAWRDVDEAGKSAAEGYNVVIHEFAHVIDMRSGAPPTPRPPTARPRVDAGCARSSSNTNASRGVPTATRRFSIPMRRVARGFFAVGSEAFFVAPATLKTEQPRLYRLLAEFYRQDRQRDRTEQGGQPAPWKERERVLGGRLGLRLVASPCRLDVEQRLAVGVDVDREPTTFDEPGRTGASSASARRIVSWISRCIGRAPIIGSKPFLASSLRSASVNVTSTFFSASWPSSSSRNLSTTRRMISSSSDLKLTIASRRLRNSGVNSRLMSAISSPASFEFVKPIDALFSDSAPALVVMMMMTLRKSALRPLLSVSVPWSITWSSTLKTSGCAFSISSSSRNACGFFEIASVSRPPGRSRRSQAARRSAGSPRGAPCTRSCRSGSGRRRG